MIRYINPTSMKPPLSQYSNGVEVAAPARWLHISGQTASAPNGVLPTDFGEQVDLAFANVAAVLEGAGMTKADLVKITVYVTVAGSEALGAYRTRRDAWLGPHAPASTYLVVAGLASPKLLVEIEAIAAAA